MKKNTEEGERKKKTTTTLAIVECALKMKKKINSSFHNLQAIFFYENITQPKLKPSYHLSRTDFHENIFSKHGSLIKI